MSTHMRGYHTRVIYYRFGHTLGIRRHIHMVLYIPADIVLCAHLINSTALFLCARRDTY